MFKTPKLRHEIINLQADLHVQNEGCQRAMVIDPGKQPAHPAPQE